MKATHKTPKLENPGGGGRGAFRRRVRGYMAERTKVGWAEYATDLEERVAELEAALRSIHEFNSRPDTTTGMTISNIVVSVLRKSEHKGTAKCP